MPNAQRMPAFFPLFWILIPQILAFVFCGSAPWSAEIPISRYAIAGTSFLFLAACASAGEYFFPENSRKRIFRAVWKIAFPVAAFFLFCTWWMLCSPPVVNRENLTAREVEIVLNVEKSFSSSEKNFNGFARVENISGAENAGLAGARIWFSLPKNAFPETSEAPGEGNVLRATGVLSGLSPERFSDPGFLRFLKRERVSALFSRAGNAELISGKDGVFSRFCASLLRQLRENLLSASAGSETRERAGHILGAMLLGDKTLLPTGQKENFLLSGTMHIFAVSGLHVSVLSGGLLFLLSSLFRLPRVAAWAGMLGVLWFYTQVVGAPPSAVRAWTMLVFLFFGKIFGRGHMAFHGLIFSAFFALLIEPSVLNNTGFLLSYFVVAAILLYGSPLEETLANKLIGQQKISFPWHTKLPKTLWNIKKGVIAGACISLAAFLAGTPIVVADFGFCSLVALISNTILIPLVMMAATGGAFVLALFCIPAIGFWLGKTIFPIIALPTVILDYCTKIFAEIPGVVELTFPYAFFGIIGSLILFLLFFSGVALKQVRTRPLLRFTLPPTVLLLFLLLFGI